MNGINKLNTLIRSMSPQLEEGVFVFCCAPLQFELGSVVPRMSFIEAEGRTLILQKEEAESLGLEFTYRCRLITLNVHSSLDAVGFLAAITNALAAAGISVNPVSGFHHDHLFVPDGLEGKALTILAGLSSAID